MKYCISILTFTLQSQGGMSNELYNTIARVTDGIYEGMLSFLSSY